MKDNWWDLQIVLIVENTWRYYCLIDEVCSKRFYKFMLKKHLEITPEEHYWNKKDYRLKKIMYFLI